MRWAADHVLLREQRPVLLRRVQPEVDVAQILVGAVLADAVHERGDLQLRAVRFDAPQLVLKDIVVAADFQIRSVATLAKSVGNVARQGQDVAYTAPHGDRTNEPILANSDYSGTW